MAFESVNVTSLKNAIISCEKSINHNTSKQLINNVSNKEIWLSDSQANLKKALKILNDNRYKDLELKLKTYLELTDSIEKYQILDRENISLVSQYNSLKKRLYYREDYTVTSTDSEGNTSVSTSSRIVKDYAVERQMEANKKKQEENKTKMAQIIKQIANSI